MKKLKKALRLLFFILVMLAAAFGVGLTGHFLPAHRDPYRNAEIKTEQIDKKRGEDDDESENEKKVVSLIHGKPRVNMFKSAAKISY